MKNLINKRLKLDIFSSTRKREAVEGRNIYSSICFHYLKMTPSSISRTMRKNHATILHSIKRTDEWYEVDDEFKKKYDEILRVASKMNTLGEKQTKKEHDLKVDSIAKTLIVSELEEKIKELEKENDNIREKYQKLLFKKTFIDDFDIPDEHVEAVKQRISMYIESLKWKGSGYNGKIYNSTDNTSQQTY